MVSMQFRRVTIKPRQMGGVPCLRGLRIPIATIVGLVAEGQATQRFSRSILISKPRTSANRFSLRPKRSGNAHCLSPLANKVPRRQRPVAGSGDSQPRTTTIESARSGQIQGLR
jgi:hypothetical protein